jgi:hypothetical protein
MKAIFPYLLFLLKNNNKLSWDKQRNKISNKLTFKNMKNSILVLMSILLLSATLVSSCQSSAKKGNNAEEKVQDAKMDLNDIRLDTISKYEQFKIEAEKVIIAQENNIKELKDKMASEKKEINADYSKKLVELESKNNELKKKLANFKNDGQDKWDSFKNEFNHDMNKLGKAFKDLTVENKK